MLIHCESINHYLAWMREGQHFAFAGFSDAEWYSILRQRVGDRTALGQVISAEHGERLFQVIKRRQCEKWFLFAVPKVLWTMPGFAEGQIDWFLGNNNILVEGYERDMVTDYMARDSEMYGWIRQIRCHSKTCMIGPAPLRQLDFLELSHFVEISTPNLHLQPGGIEDAVADAVRWGKHIRDAIYLVSAGVSAAVIIDQLYEQLPPAWLFDCGSMWDAFVGTGGQREWRAKLYADPVAYEKWKNDNIYSKDGRGW